MVENVKQALRWIGDGGECRRCGGHRIPGVEVAEGDIINDQGDKIGALAGPIFEQFLGFSKATREPFTSTNARPGDSISMSFDNTPVILETRPETNE